MLDECYFFLFSGHAVSGEKLEQIKQCNLVCQDHYLEGDGKRRKCQGIKKKEILQNVEKRSVLAGTNFLALSKVLLILLTNVYVLAEYCLK